MDKLKLTKLKVCPFFPQKFHLFIDMSPSFAFLHRSGFLISHHGSFMGGRFHVGLGLFRGFVNSQAAAQSLRIEKELISFQETSTLGSSEKSLSYTVEHQVGFIIDSFNCTTPFDVCHLQSSKTNFSSYNTHSGQRKACCQCAPPQQQACRTLVRFQLTGTCQGFVSHRAAPCHHISPCSGPELLTIGTELYLLYSDYFPLNLSII